MWIQCEPSTVYIEIYQLNHNQLPIMTSLTAVVRRGKKLSDLSTSAAMTQSATGSCIKASDQMMGGTVHESETYMCRVNS